MVKTTNSNIRSSGLDAVVEQLKINNEATLKQTNAINTLLQDNQNARLEEKRTLVASIAVLKNKLIACHALLFSTPNGSN